MTIRLIPLILAIALLGCSKEKTAEVPNIPITPDVESVVKGNNDFALDLYAELGDEEPGNLFFSPYSLSVAMAMTYAGARGETEKEMAEAMHFTLPQDQLHPTFAALTENIEARSKQQDCQLDIANRLWGQKGSKFLTEFLQFTHDDYGAELAQVDFTGNTDAVRHKINAWVEEQTNEKIRNLILPGVLNPETKLVLTNAIYFKGNWANQFDSEYTRDVPFHISAEETIGVPIMHQKEEFKYGETENLQILEMPYIGDELSMLILLPKTLDGLPELEKNLTTENLTKWFTDLQKEEVYVSFPKFTMTSQFRLDEVLESLGMSSAFGEADFSGMNGTNDLFLQAVVHKAFVDVNEEETEAAAATAAAAGAESELPHLPSRSPIPFPDPPQPNRHYPVHGTGGEPEGTVTSANPNRTHRPTAGGGFDGIRWLWVGEMW